MPLKFQNKADNLAILKDKLISAEVLPQYCFTMQQWKSKRNTHIEFIKNLDWPYDMIIVRSCSLSEDCLQKSMAGKFLSLANIQLKDIPVAIDKVFDSYNSQLNTNKVFVQPMLENIAISGVVLSQNLNGGGHYYTINYDDLSGDPSAVTSGKHKNLKTYIQFKLTDICSDKKLLPVIKLTKELECLFNTSAIDIEFAINKHDKLFLLQLRPLCLNKQIFISPEQQAKSLQQIYDKIYQYSKPKPFLFGKRGIYGIMPDWNPAEIIGIKPKPLALSLYKELITDSIWAYQRDNYGYKKLRSFPLLISFAGLPYIDVRVSFNSFIPASLSDHLSEKLVNYYVERLTKTPSHHDKIEFEIIHSCYTFDIEKKMALLKSNGFSSAECKELTDALLEITNEIISSDGLWHQDIHKIEKLTKRQNTIMYSKLDDLEKIYWLLEDCKRYGTLPFAGLARAGFIAMQLLKSLLTEGVFSSTDYNLFLASLKTISSEIQVDFKELSRHKFLEKYGHLRPGTYDILSPRYDESPDQYFNWKNNNKEPLTKKSKPFGLTLDCLNKLESILKKNQINHDILSLFDFIKGAIQGREYAKFVFTKSVSDVLKLFGNLCQQYGFSRAEASYIDISIIKQLYSSDKTIKDVINRSICLGKSQHLVTKGLHLPALIVHPEDIFSFHIPINSPNFITQRSVIAEVIGGINNRPKLEKKIIMIPSADPGYDWLFSQKIAGLITMYGGANSHMAIRASELDLPAIIGAGELLYNLWSKANRLHVDCLNQLVEIL